MLVVLLFLSLLIPVAARAQTFEVGAGVVVANSTEFNNADFGVSGRLGWNPFSIVGIEGEATIYPREFPNGVAFTARRVEGLFGITIGPRIDRVRPFARARAGFLNFAAAPGPIACITIYPPPLSCVLAARRTMPAFDLGGGIEFSTTTHTFARVDVGARFLKYPGPSFTRSHASLEGFYSHDFRFALGAGLKF